MTQVRLEPAALWSRVKHSTTEPLRSLQYGLGPVAWLYMDLDEEQDSSKHNGKCKRPIWAGSGSVVRYGPG